MAKNRSKKMRRGAALIAAALLVVGLILARSWHRSSHAPGDRNVSSHAQEFPAAAKVVAPKAGGGSNALSAAERSRREALFASFRLHPYSATTNKDGYAWTSENGKDPAVIRELAHNEFEFERMAQENDRIYGRQLVYHTDTIAAQIERSRLTGKSLSRIELPGLDGREVPFEITTTDLNPSRRQGTLAGRVAGQPDSMVTLAFKDGREAFTVLSPQSDLYLVGEPREPGELIVKSVNPQTYFNGVCGTRDK